MVIKCKQLALQEFLSIISVQMLKQLVLQEVAEDRTGMRVLVMDDSRASFHLLADNSSSVV